MKCPTTKKELAKALYICYLEARRNKRKTQDEHSFELFETEDLDQLLKDIVTRKYTPGRSKAFISHNPVAREIFAAPFRDRIVHHFLFKTTIEGWWDKRLINDSYSCRRGKGTDYGVKRLRKMMNIVSAGGEREAYVIQGDLKGYFTSLPRVKLLEQIIWGLERQFPEHQTDKEQKKQYDLLRFLWSQVILDDPIKGVRMAGSKKDWKVLPKEKSLFFQTVLIGIVIGNLTSQGLSNIYLDQLDRFMKYDMGFKYYGRYVDDFFVVVTKDELEYALFVFNTILPEFLDCLGLTLHPNKMKVTPVSEGVKFLGKYVHLDHVQLGKRTRDRFYRAVQKRVMNLVDDETIISYLGMGKHYRARKATKKIFESVGWEVSDWEDKNE